MSEGDADACDEEDERRRPVEGEPEENNELLNRELLPLPDVGEAVGSSISTLEGPFTSLCWLYWKGEGCDNDGREAEEGKTRQVKCECQA